ncbi:hypothetical protein ACVIQY_001838 [Bradyrhizobium sp. USDA 3051]
MIRKPLFVVLACIAFSSTAFAQGGGGGSGGGAGGGAGSAASSGAGTGTSSSSATSGPSAPSGIGTQGTTTGANVNTSSPNPSQNNPNVQPPTANGKTPAAAQAERNSGVGHSANGLPIGSPGSGNQQRRSEIGRSIHQLSPKGPPLWAFSFELWLRIDRTACGQCVKAGDEKIDFGDAARRDAGLGAARTASPEGPIDRSRTGSGRSCAGRHAGEGRPDRAAVGQGRGWQAALGPGCAGEVAAFPTGPRKLAGNRQQPSVRILPRRN